MKALTLHQPHATLIALGAKPWETRSWGAPTSLIGQRLAIHAGKRLDAEAIHDGSRVSQALGKLAIDTGLLPRGGIVAVVELLKCRKTTDLDRRIAGRYYRANSRPEDFGDFSAGRWVWETKLLLRVHPHIVCCGWRGLWNVPAAIEAVLEEALSDAKSRW